MSLKANNGIQWTSPDGSAMLDLDNELSKRDADIAGINGGLLALSERVDALENSQPVQVYGVTIDTENSNPETAVQYTDDAVGFTPSRGNNGNYISGGLDKLYPFNAIKPCLFNEGAVVGYLDENDFTKFEDGTAADITSGNAGDVMIEIPHFYYKIARNGKYVEVKASNAKLSGFTDFAFSYKGAVKDKFYAGAYMGYADVNGKLRSISGVTPAASKTIGAFRAAAQANGDGYEQLCFNKLTALQVLYLLRFKSLNSQTALGTGYTGASAYANTGTANQRGMNYGTTSADVQCKCNGIEDFFGNFYQWADGCKAGASGTNTVLLTDGNFNDAGDGYAAFSANMAENGSYLKDVVGDGNLAFTPKNITGSSSTYYSDYGYLAAGGLPVFGGYRSGGATAGAFCLYVGYSASDAAANVGARLIYAG